MIKFRFIYFGDIPVIELIRFEKGDNLMQFAREMRLNFEEQYERCKTN